MVLRRNTKTVSVSLPPKIFKTLERIRQEKAKTRNEMIRDLILGYTEEERWGKIFAWGEKTAQKFNLKTEADIERVLHGS